MHYSRSNDCCGRWILRQKDYVNAITLLKGGLEILSQDAQLTQQLQLYEKAQADLILSTALSNAAKYAETENYSFAITILEQYIAANGEHVDVGVMLNTYREKLSAQMRAAALDTAEAYAQTGDYISAINTLNTYIGDYGAEATVVLALNGYTESYVDVVLANAGASVNGGDYVSAIQTIRGAQKNVTADRLTTRLNTYTAAYEAEIIAEADALLAKEDYDGAQAVVEQGLMILPNSTALERQSKKVEDERPKNLMDVCPPYNRGDDSGCTVLDESDSMTMSGKTYYGGFMLATWTTGWDTWAFCNLEGKFEELTFTVGHIDGAENKDVVLQIVLDGKIYDSYDVRYNSLPYTITVPVEGVNQIQFFIANCRPYIGFANLYVK